MRQLSSLLLVALSLVQAGCQISKIAATNLVGDTVRYCDDCELDRRSRREADVAWNAVACQAPADQAFSEDYARGFRDGFTDYLREGGTGEPPVVPPSRYWKVEYQSPAGHQAIEDWFAGFRHGAAQARASGIREQLIIIPVSGSLLPPREAEQLPPPPAAGPPQPPDEELPPPRPADPSGG